MKMIEVFDLMAKKEIKHETQLIIHYDSVCSSFRYHKLYQTFLNDNYERMEEEFIFGDDFLNFEVELIPPKPKKYYLRLDKDDNCSYINKNVYFSYEVANKSEHNNCKTKFTQEEIDGSIFLKFIEQHGIKEEVDEND
ncbi:hypothetical protein [Enterococcus cecorum]|uniref:hypothetical protein n=1 Tax=Enterococcus cecorum TaxID=44008 RepID=UPI00148B40B1|nr:hypothetical protein [Enterococcus cecorum]